MVKLTAEIIQNAMQYFNPVKDRELNLRGYKIPEVENLGATCDQFDTIDFSDNDIRILDGFPYLKRLKCLLLNNNRIVRIGEHLLDHIPNMEMLILTGNQIEELGDLDPLISLDKLTHLSLLHNPVTAKPHYRLYVAYKFPQIRILDFRRIKQKERDEARKLFKSKKGKELQHEISQRAKTFVPGGEINNLAKAKGLSDQEVAKIRQAITVATSLEEVEMLHQMLQAGRIPGEELVANGNEMMEVENGN